jgi:chromosome segregation ATPase
MRKAIAMLKRNINTNERILSSSEHKLQENRESSDALYRAEGEVHRLLGDKEKEIKELEATLKRLRAERAAAKGRLRRLKRQIDLRFARGTALYKKKEEARDALPLLRAALAALLGR